MAFTGNEDHSFPLETAAEWTKNYRDSAGTNAVKGHYFGGTFISEILAQQNCVGIRIYYALDENGAKQLIIVGVDSNENDLEDGLIAERSVACPPTCGNNNALNS